MFSLFTLLCTVQSLYLSISHHLHRLISIGNLLFRISHTWLQLLTIFTLLITGNTVFAAKQSEFNAQKNIYATEWARLKHQAELGNPDALFTLGNYYYQPPKGSTFRKNLKKSAEFYFRAGIRGNAAAQYNFGYMLHEGLGVTKNVVESYAWFKLASLNQSPVAKHINQVSTKAIVTLEKQLAPASLAQAKKRVKFYVDVIEKKRYRRAKFPG